MNVSTGHGSGVLRAAASRCVVVAVVMAALLLAGGAVSAEEPPWRFTLVRPPAGLEMIDASGGVDLTGDGIHDVVTRTRPAEPGTEMPGDPVAQVVSGAPQHSWVTDVESPSQVVRGLAAADGLPVPFGCVNPLEDVNGDGLGELLVASCPEQWSYDYAQPRVFVVFGSSLGFAARLAALGGDGYEVDLAPVHHAAVISAAVPLADVDGDGSPGMAVMLRPDYPSPSAEREVRVYRLSEGGAELWAVYPGGSAPRSAGDFHGDGGTDLLVSDYDDEGASVLAIRLPDSPAPTPRRLSDLNAEEATELRRFARSGGTDEQPGGQLPGIEFNGVGDLNADGYDDVLVGTGGVNESDTYVSFGRSVVLGGPASVSRPRGEFTIDGGGFGQPPIPTGDVNGDGIHDLLIEGSFGNGFFVVYGSRTLEPVHLGDDGERVTWVVSPLDTSTSMGRAAPLGGGPGGGPVRIAASAEHGLLVFESPAPPPRDGVAFGQPSRGFDLTRIEGDPSEIPEATVPGEAEAVAQSLAISRSSFAGSEAEHVILASAASYADALSATPLLGRGPLLLTPHDALPQAVYDEIARLLPADAPVYVMGGEAAVGEAVIEQLTEQLTEECAYSYPSRCVTVQRVAGPSRVETSAAVARLVGAPNGEVAVARAYGTLDETGAEVTGAGWADAVTAGGWAAATGTPVLLTPAGEGLHPAVADLVGELGVSSTVVLGGTAAVSERAAADLPGVNRIAGRDRAETAVAISEQLWPSDTTRRILVHGYREDGWTAGLPAAALAADGGAPLLLVHDEELPQATADALRACPPEEPADVLAVGHPHSPNYDPLGSRVRSAQYCSPYTS